MRPLLFIPADNLVREKQVSSSTSCIDIKQTAASSRLSNGTIDPAADDLQAIKRKEAIRVEMEGRWAIHKELIEDYFPVSILDGFEAEFADFENDNFLGGRWKQLPNPGVTNETNFVLPGFLELLKAILAHFGSVDSRRSFRNTHSERMLPRDVLPSTIQQRWLSPDVFIGGIGECFPLPTTYCAPDSEPPSWKWCIALMDAKTPGGRSKLKGDKLQLGTYAREVFSAQDNRRYFPCFIFTQNILQLYVFDRTGAMFSEDLFYHQNRKQFCAVILSVFFMDDVDLGFDPTNYYDKHHYITTQEIVDGDLKPVRYIIDECFWHSTALVGDCTICWKAKREESDDYYLIKDSWVVGGSENEGTLLRNGFLANGGGLAPIVHHEDVWITPSVDSIRNNRPPKLKLDAKHNRIHTRVVMRISGMTKPLESFSDCAELLVSLRDAILGHRNLYAAGVLHCDVTPFCILIQPDGTDGNHGLLLDFRCAVSSNQEDLGESNAHISPVDRLGSTPFQSCYALGVVEDTRAHSYMDDLESFYYVLIYMVSCHSGPGPITVVPRPLFFNSWWKTPMEAGSIKFSRIHMRNFDYKVQPYFGDAMKRLLQNLHAFFRVRFKGTVRPAATQEQEGDGTRVKTDHADLEKGMKRCRSDAETDYEDGQDKSVVKRSRLK